MSSQTPRRRITLLSTELPATTNKREQLPEDAPTIVGTVEEMMQAFDVHAAKEEADYLPLLLVGAGWGMRLRR